MPESLAEQMARGAGKQEQKTAREPSSAQVRPRKKRLRGRRAETNAGLQQEAGGSALGARKASERQDESSRYAEWDEKQPELSALPEVAQRNPHVAQAFANTSAGYQCRDDLCFERELTQSWPRRQYRRRKHEYKTVIHWGQRKLLMAEIEFLTMHGHLSSTVVYAGAAPGTHITYLAELFPSHTFWLYDPAPFTVAERNNIICKQESFTETVAKKFGGCDVLFISDVRAADPSIDEENEVDAKVKEDMDNQKRWHFSMRPRYSLLKFRLSWRPGKTTYLSGSVRLPVWGPITTTECRLMAPQDAELVEYDNTAYEEQMFYFNTEARVALYTHSVKAEGMDMCYDCSSEVTILRNYLRSTMHTKGIQRKGETDDATVARMSFNISRAISSERTLASFNPDPEQRRCVIQKRQFVNGMPAYEAEQKRQKLANDSVAERVHAGAYSSAAVRMMHQMGWHENAGLGAEKRGQQMPPTVAHGAAQTANNRHGLGFDSDSTHKVQDDNSIDNNQ